MEMREKKSHKSMKEKEEGGNEGRGVRKKEWRKS